MPLTSKYLSHLQSALEAHNKIQRAISAGSPVIFHELHTSQHANMRGSFICNLINPEKPGELCPHLASTVTVWSHEAQLCLEVGFEVREESEHTSAKFTLCERAEIAAISMIRVEIICSLNVNDVEIWTMRVTGELSAEHEMLKSHLRQHTEAILPETLALTLIRDLIKQYNDRF